jgi:hypothetical protein
VANTLDNVIPQLLAQGLLALREMAVMPLLVNREYETMAGPVGSSIDVPLPSTVTVQTVSPAATPPSTADQEPGTVAIPLDQWKEAPFYLTDKDMLEVQSGVLPMMASEAIRGLANNVDTYLLDLGTKFYGVHGTAGTTPFQTSIADATQIRKVLNNQLSPMDSRRLVMNADAEAEALELRAFHDASFGVGGAAILEGQITRRLGFEWFMDQNVRTHIAGAAAGYLVNEGSGAAVGIKTVTIDTGSGAFNVGDIVTFAGHTQTYVITASVGGASATSITFEPGLTTAVANNAAITAGGDTGGIGDHVMNLAFHRDAIAFATRPLAASNHPASIIQSAVDPVSGLTLRLEVTREHKRDRFSYDILYGANVVRRELGARLLG